MTIKKHTFENGYTVEVQQGEFAKFGFTYKYRVLISAHGFMCETQWYDNTADMLEGCWCIMSRDTAPRPLYV